MSGFDKSDKLIRTYKVLMKCVCWWKMQFFHCTDIAVVNSFMMSIVCSIPKSRHCQEARFDQFTFRQELMEQLLRLEPQHTGPKDPAVAPATSAPEEV